MIGKLVGYVTIISLMAPAWVVGYFVAAIQSGFRRGVQDFEDII